MKLIFVNEQLGGHKSCTRAVYRIEYRGNYVLDVESLLELKPRNGLSTGSEMCGGNARARVNR